MVLQHDGSSMDDARLSAKNSSGTTGSLYWHVVYAVGQAIVDGDLAAGDPVLAEALGTRYGVSRSVVREAVRTLESMGLVRSRRHSGTRVRPDEEWDLLNPHVVHWRARGRGYLTQMRQLLELRLGVEPAAAGLAAHRMKDEQTEKLRACARDMELAFTASDPHAFFRLDSVFHRLVLEGSLNAVVAQLADTIDETLAARRDDNRPGMPTLTKESVQRHRVLAESITSRDADAAERAARSLVASTLAEFELLEKASLAETGGEFSVASS